MNNPTAIPIFIISLKNAQERRSRITKIMTEMGLSFEFIDAVDGRNFDMTAHPHYDGQKRLKFFGRDLTGGELGCALSHKKIYAHMVNQKIDRAFILEDDVTFYDGFLDTYNDILNTKTPYDMIRFFGSPKMLKAQQRNIKTLPHGAKLTRMCAAPGGTYAYIMTLTGAKKLLPHLEKVFVPIDALAGRSWNTGLNWLAVMPLLVYVDFDLGSEIGNKRFDKTLQISGVNKILYPMRRAWFKLCETTGKKFWYAKNYLKDKKHEQC